MATKEKQGHTPGPWNCEAALTVAGTQQEVQGKTGTPIYHDGFHIGTWIDNEWDGNCPNARLIAAAPDLLQALNRAELSTTQIRLAANICHKSAKSKVSWYERQLEQLGREVRAAIAKAEKGE